MSHTSHTPITRRGWLQASAGWAAQFVPRAHAGPRDEFRVRAFEGSKEPASPERFQRLIAVAPDSTPSPIQVRAEHPGLAQMPAPTGEFALKMPLRIGDFGTVYLHADNEGRYYTPAQVAGRELLINYEFARSRAAQVRRYLESAQREGIRFPPLLMRRLEKGEYDLRKAASATIPEERAAYSNDSLTETLWAGEMAVFERARQRIARNGPRPGFLFGAAAFGYPPSAGFLPRFTEIFNYATLPFYRGTTEAEEGRLSYSQVEAMLPALLRAGVKLKGHPLLWFHRASIPRFLRSKSYDAIRQSCRDYILQTVGRFRSQIHIWDVINEAHDWANELDLTPGQLLEMTRMAAESAREADPTAFRIVNACLPWGEYLAFGRNYSGPLKPGSRTPLQYFQALQQAGIRYEAVGLQIYYPGYDMLEIERQTERFFTLGKPVHITELGVPTAPTPASAGGAIPYDLVWHGEQWNEPLQADWLEQFYTLCYSRPEIEAVSWWVFADSLRGGDRLNTSGLLTERFEPKESYRRLQKLLTSWGHSRAGTTRPPETSRTG